MLVQAQRLADRTESKASYPLRYTTLDAMGSGVSFSDGCVQQIDTRQVFVGERQ
jgi:hypothetical protein